MRDLNKKLTADEALNIQLRGTWDMLPRGSDREASANKAIARNVLHEELGHYADQQTVYNLDEETRDRLIAHGRQDTAHALLNSITLMNEMRKLKRWFAVACAAFLAMVIWVWWRG